MRDIVFWSRHPGKLLDVIDRAIVTSFSVLWRNRTAIITFLSELGKNMWLAEQKGL